MSDNPRDRIAEALYQWMLDQAAPHRLHPPYLDARTEEAMRVNSLARADAVMAIVQPAISEKSTPAQPTRDANARERDGARISDIQRDVWKTKIEKGFNTTDPNLEFNLLYGEVAEAFDAYRKHPDQLAHELADILIYTVSLAEMHGINLEQAVVDKMEINAARIYQPGPNGTLIKEPGQHAEGDDA